MSWLPPATDQGTPLENTLSWRPELRDAFRRYYATLWDKELLPPRLLELCRLRIAAMHECAPELAIRHQGSGVSDQDVASLAHWQGATCFSDAERAALAYAEQIPWQHQFISDEQAEAVKLHLNDSEYVAFTIAICLFDEVCRLKNLFDLPPSARGPVPQPAAADGTLY